MSCTKVRFHWYNLVTQDATDITASSENSLYPATNIKSHFSTKVYRSETGTASANVVFDFKTSEDVNAILIKASPDGFGFNGALTIEANGSDSWGSPAYSNTLTPSATYGLGILHLSSAESYRYWRISGTGTTYFEISNIFIGSYYSPGKNISLGWRYDNEDLSKVSNNRYGQRFIDRIGDQVKIRADLKWLWHSSDLQDWNEFVDYVGIHDPFWLVMDPDETFSYDSELFAGQFLFDSRPALANMKFGYYNTSLRMTECT